MEAFAVHIVQHPMLYIGYLFATAGAFGMLIFFAGFFGGIEHLFTYSEDVHHVEHSRTRSLWGLYICMVSLGAWQCLRILVGDAPLSSVLLILILLSPAWAPPLKHALFG